MKKRKEHRVPLSRQVVGILDEARARPFRGSRLRRPQQGRRAPRPLRSGEMSKVLRQLGLKDAEGRAAVAHGFRSTFADWVADHEPDSSEAADAALAHYPASSTRKRYQRNATTADCSPSPHAKVGGLRYPAEAVVMSAVLALAARSALSFVLVVVGVRVEVSSHASSHEVRSTIVPLLVPRRVFPGGSHSTSPYP